MIRKLQKMWENETFRKAIYIFLIAKIAVLAVGYAGYFLIPPEDSSRKQITTNELLNPWAQYDGRAYLDIAENGYNSNFNEAGNYGFYPLYPVLIKAFSFTGYDTAAFLLSNVFSLLAVILLFKIVDYEFGPKIAKKSVVYLVMFPTAYFLSVMYSESLFIFLTILTFYYARRGNWAAAGIVGFFASLTRLQGVILLIPVAYLYFSKIKFNFRRTKTDSLLLLLIPAGTAVFMLYVYLITGDPLIWTKSFAANGKHFSMPWTTLYNEYINFSVSALKGKIYSLFNFTITVSMIGLCYFSKKYMKNDYTIYAIFSTLLPLFSGSLEAISRYALAVFPFFILLPVLEEKYRRFGTVLKILLVVSVLLLIVLTIRHVNMHLDPYGL